MIYFDVREGGDDAYCASSSATLSLQMVAVVGTCIYLSIPVPSENKVHGQATCNSTPCKMFHTCT